MIRAIDDLLASAAFIGLVIIGGVSTVFWLAKAFGDLDGDLH